jgi:predicted transcriptional regulator of viral defense system
MDIKQEIAKYEGQLITHQMLIALLKDYSRPNDKIKTLKDEGILESVKRGFYIAGSNTNITRPERTLIANHLYGPSYVSMEAALMHYGLIPERVYTITSMTTKTSKSFRTPGGLYTYTNLPLPYYSFGLETALVNINQQIIIASPEKALADKIATTPGIILRSMSSARDYLSEDLRIELSDLRNFDTHIMTTWITAAPKSESLATLIKTIQKL